MCGIAGIVQRSGSPDLAALERMQAKLAHRGPDSDGRFVDGAVALAHTRLSIIDLAGGQQPLHGAGGRHCLVANGEIYNFPTLRERIKADGYQFSTHSDCEVILPLYARHGAACVDHMRGMFAFALWDAERGSLLLGRDRMGEKPLYYAHNGERFVFASELRAILASGLLARELDAKEITRYFRYQYVPEPRTPFIGIEKVPAGTTLEFDVANWQLRKKIYWSPWEATPLEGDPKAHIRGALEDAVKTSLISDVPIGLSLSGGIDSSILACLMKAYSSKDVHAVSIGYPDASGVDERPQARQLAERLGLIYHDVELNDVDMVRTFPSVAAWRDDPIGDISGYNYHAIMRHARERGIKVMLQGHGVDELCWGYPWVKDAVALNEAGGLDGTMGGSASIRDRLAALLRRLRGDRDRGAAGGFQMFELQPYTAWVMEHGGELFPEDYLEASAWHDLTPDREYGNSGLSADLEVTRLIVEFYLRGNGIAQGDRLSMANSVEVRLPFVDHKFVETVIGLRKAQRDDHLPLKHWIKESVRDLLGDEILDRPKRGFAPPAARWQKALREEYGSDLTDGYLVEQGILTSSAAASLSQPELSNASQAIVSRLAITLEFWARGVVLGETPAKPAALDELSDLDNASGQRT